MACATVKIPRALSDLLVSSPFALIRRQSLELRPELGAYIVDLERVGCSRCDGDAIPFHDE